jgi:glycosyltransferase involved in cell wall biosynthesis
MKIIFITPVYNAKPHLPDLIESLQEQTNENWELHIVDDLSTDDSYEYSLNVAKSDKRIKVIKNTEKCWALKNVIKVARNFENDDNVILATLDGDDALCNENTVDLILNEYENNNLDALWTAHSWDINGMNISGDLPAKINPYHYPWVSSHLKTWRGSILKNISDDNFKDLDGQWFKRGYDQALYLPILLLAKERKFLDEICYLYRINSNSIQKRDKAEKEQLDTVKLVRYRGYIK